MKRIKSIKQLEKLKNGTILIQKYHPLSGDCSKFDINKKEKDRVILLEEVGGLKRCKKNTSTLIRTIDIKNRTRVYLYVADTWMQRLYR